MDPHLLRTFTMIARLGSFSAAARELGYTQSAVSQHMATLETDLGAALLTRRPVALTEAGARLLEHAGPLLLRLDAARADVARVAAGPPDGLAAGVSPLATTAGFAAALAAMRRTHPVARVTVRAATREEIIAGVADGAFDLGLVDGVAAPTDPLHLPGTAPMTAVAIAEEPLAVVLPADHPLAARTGLDLADLADACWIDAPGAGVPLARLRAATGAAGFRPSLRYEGTDVRGLVALAVAGHGLTLLPRSAAGAAAVPILAPRLVHRTEVVHGSLPDGPAATLLRAWDARGYQL